MFTGIVEETGVVTGVEKTEGGRRFVVEAPGITAALPIGASVAVQGACLTVVATAGPSFIVELVAETLSRTALGSVTAGATVNLERAMAATGRFDGHLVQGHVDGVGTVRSVETEGAGRRIGVECPQTLRRYVVEKGSITVDGVSLTVADLDEDGFEVALIPHTLGMTTLGTLRVGDRVNLEVDILAKYVERLLEAHT